MNWIEFNSFELAQLSEFGLYSASLQRDTLWKKFTALASGIRFHFWFLSYFLLMLLCLRRQLKRKRFSRLRDQVSVSPS